MSILSKAGLYKKGKFIYAKVGRDGAVIVCAKANKTMHLAVPEKLGRRTVRGIANSTDGPRYSLISSLPEKTKDRIYDVLEKYADVREFHSCTLPDTIEYIGAYPAFSPEIIDTLVLPRNVSYVNTYAILKVKNLVLPRDIRIIGTLVEKMYIETVTLGDEPSDEGVPHATLEEYGSYPGYSGTYAKYVGERAFMDASQLKTATLPDDIEYIGGSAFKGCSSLTGFKFPHGLKKLAETAFVGASFKGEYHYPSDFPLAVEWDKMRMNFRGPLVLDSEESFERLRSAITGYNNSPFASFATALDLSCLSGVITSDTFTAPNGKKIYGYANVITLGEGVTEIGAEAFAHSQIRFMYIPDGVRAIRKNAFKDCRNMMAIRLPDSIETLEEDALYTGNAQLRIFASEETIERIKTQPGYVSYLKQAQEAQKYVDDYIKGNEKYFNTDAEYSASDNAYSIDALEKVWKTKMQHPLILKKIIQAYECAGEPIPFPEAKRNELCDISKILQMHSLIEIWEKVYKSRVDYAAELANSETPSDWLKALKIDAKNEAAVEKTLSLLIMHYQPRYTPVRKRHPFADHIEVFMEDAFLNLRDRSIFDRLSSLFEESLGYKWTYSPQRFSSSLKLAYVDHSFVSNCEYYCSLGDKQAEYWDRLARLFRPDYKMPPVRNLLAEYLAESEKQAAAASINSSPTYDFSSSDYSTAYTPSYISNYGSDYYSSYSSSYSQDSDSGFVMDDILSDYYAGLAAAAEAQAIEDEWLELAYYGFWNDTSWM